MSGGHWKRYGRLDGSRAGAKAIRVYQCNGCGAPYRHKAPAQCQGCGRMDFSMFHSDGEFKKWAALQLQERAKLISNLRRQVPLPLYTIDPRGQKVQWGEMVVDFAYTDEEGDHLVDFKPQAGPSPDSVLKMRCLEKQGIIVEIVT